MHVSECMVIQNNTICINRVKTYGGCHVPTAFLGVLIINPTIPYSVQKAAHKSMAKTCINMFEKILTFLGQIENLPYCIAPIIMTTACTIRPN